MNTLKITKIALTTSAILMGTTTLVSAAGSSNCEVVYGGGEVCPPNVSFTLDKLVQTPGKGGQFVDNLTMNDAAFTQNQEVVFQLKVKNTGDKTISKITVVDTLPAQLTHVGGSGTVDSTKKTVTINVENLEKGKEAVYFINTKVTGQTGNVQCITNVVKATDNTGNTAEDTANLCVQTPGVQVQPQVPTKKIPETGPEALALFVLPPLGAAGLYLRRKAGL